MLTANCKLCRLFRLLQSQQVAFRRRRKLFVLTCVIGALVAMNHVGRLIASAMACECKRKVNRHRSLGLSVRLRLTP